MSSLFKVTTVAYRIEDRVVPADTPGAVLVVEHFRKGNRVVRGTPGAKEVRKYVIKGKRVPASQKDAPSVKKVIIVSSKWYGRYRNASGKWVTKALDPDKTCASQMLAKKMARDSDATIEEEVLRRYGIKPETAEQSNRPLAEHLEDYKRAMIAKERTQRQIDQVIARVRKILDGCRFVFMRDIDALAIGDWLADRRKTTPAKGKQQRFSIRTSNHYLSAVKSFSRWMVRNGRAKEDPLVYLSGGNPEVDIRHARRDLPAEDFDRFVDAARTGKTFRKLTGADRAMLYVLAANTGLRRNELASLTPESFDLDATMPTVTVEAAYSKHRRRDVQPLRSDVAAMMKAYLEGKPAGKPVWPGTWKERTNRMVERDLAAAKATWVKEGGSQKEKSSRARADRLNYQDAGGRFFDFHSLRHQFISNLARGGAQPKEAQVLARHSDIRLTMNTYTHLRPADAARALDGLPAIGRVCTRFAISGSAVQPEASRASQDENTQKTA